MAEFMFQNVAYRATVYRTGILGHEYDIDREFYTIHLAQKLLSESDYVVSIPFLSILNDDLSGFYRR